MGRGTRGTEWQLAGGGSVVTGLMGCSISSYLLANLGLLLTNFSGGLNLRFKCGDGVEGGGGSGDASESDSSDDDSSASEGSASEKAGE